MVRTSCISLKEFLDQLDEDMFIEELSILMVLKNEYCLGRRALAKKTCISERRVREAIGKLIDKGFLMKNNDVCVDEAKLNTLTQLCFKHFTRDNYVLTVTCCFDNELLDNVRRKITSLRDHVVISTGKPWVFEIIGIRIHGKTILPKVPKHIAFKYREFLNQVFDDGSILVLWRDYEPFISESILLQGLLKICVSNK